MGKGWRVFEQRGAKGSKGDTNDKKSSVFLRYTEDSSILITCQFTSPQLPLPSLHPQEIPFNHSDSKYMFRVSELPLTMYPSAIEQYGLETIAKCFNLLQLRANRQNGLAKIQTFVDSTGRDDLTFIDEMWDEQVGVLVWEDF